ncbi:MAG: serine/threonine-protein kinase [Proteobacteria bacterium]|nr:serine/threonine-protein kinase [Pseudomonadota bacterium]
MKPEPGEQIAEYRLVKRLGDGAAATVWHAARRDHSVALKLFHDNVTSREDFTRAFKQEAGLLKTIDHPNIVSVEDHGYDERSNSFYIAMKLIKGATLAQIAPYVRGNPHAIQIVLWIASQTTVAVKYLHNKGIIHRDISPENIIASTNGTITIVDLGVSRTGVHYTQHTQVAVGKAGYMAPEVMEGSLCKESDIFSLGRVLAYLLYGNRYTDLFFQRKILSQQGTLAFLQHALQLPTKEQRFQKLLRRLADPQKSRRPSADDIHNQLLELLGHSRHQHLAQECITAIVTTQFPNTGYIALPDHDARPEEAQDSSTTPTRRVPPADITPTRSVPRAPPHAMTLGLSQGQTKAVSTPSKEVHNQSTGPHTRPVTQLLPAAGELSPTPSSSRLLLPLIGLSSSILLIGVVLISAKSCDDEALAVVDASVLASSAASASTPVSHPVADAGPVPNIDQPVCRDIETCESKCQNGMERACGWLGMAYEYGRGIEIDLSKALDYYKRACDPSSANQVDDVAACIGLGWMHEFGKGTPMDALTASDYYQRSCSQSSAIACIHMGFLYYTGRIPTDKPLTKTFFDKACPGKDDAGIQTCIADFLQQRCSERDPRSCHRLASYAPEDTARREAHEQACSLDEKQSCTVVALANAQENPSRSHKELGQLCDGGELTACLQYARNDRTILPKQRVELLTKACTNNLPQACYDLANLYTRGRPIRKDSKEALRLLRKSCRLNLGAACFELGKSYENGRLGEKDKDESLHWYKRSCELDDEMCCGLAQMVDHGSPALASLATGLRQKIEEVRSGGSCR